LGWHWRFCFVIVFSCCAGWGHSVCGSSHYASACGACDFDKGSR
jgi:hypothetical protein